MNTDTTKRPLIAVVGVSALYPGSNDASGFWRDILAGRDLLSDVPNSHWLIDDYYDEDPKAPDKTYAKRGAFLEKVDFDCMEYGIPPNLIEATDSAQLLALIVARKVLEDAAGGDFQHLDRSRMSVILGATGTTELAVHLGARLHRPQWLQALRESGIEEDRAQSICDRIASQYVPWQEGSFPGLLGNVIAGRIANRFDLGGTNCIVDAACASSLSALSMGMNELYLGHCDFVITGGVDTLNDILMYMCFSKTPALSPSGDCRPFSDHADGTMLGEGLAMVALRRLEDAERDGDRVYAVIRGIGSSSDGRAKSVYAPLAEGQSEALRRAYQEADYAPCTVELVEAHGTATKAGDVAEFEGLRNVFGASGSDKNQWCALGSLKSQVGHTKGAAGAGSLFKIVMALHHKILPPTIKIDKPNPKLDVESSPFYLNTSARPWIRGSEHPRRASVSSFGFGGSNFHATLEEYCGKNRAWRLRSSPVELVVVSADDREALFASCRELVNGCHGAEALSHVARCSQTDFQFNRRHRIAFVVRSIDELAQRIEEASAHDGRSENLSSDYWYEDGGQSGKIAVVFPGQGSQYVGMGKDLTMAFEEVREVWDEAARTPLDPTTQLHDVVFAKPAFDARNRAAQERFLTQTEWAQPAIGATSLAAYALLCRLGLQADAFAGHSFGEVTALCAAQVFASDQALRVARRRGELMAELSTGEGAMTAVLHDVSEVEAILRERTTDVVLANHNSPRQVVLSGSCEAIEEIEATLRQCKFNCQRLPVSTAFHSPLVSAASDPFARFLAGIEFDAPKTTVYANATAAPYPQDAQAVRETLASQIKRPVLFADQISAMYDAGVRTFVEVGPGSTLTRFIGEILSDRSHTAISMDRKGVHGLESFWRALAQLVVLGVPMNLTALWETIKPIEAIKKSSEPRLCVAIDGINHNKPYPPPEGEQAVAKPVRHGHSREILDPVVNEHGQVPAQQASTHDLAFGPSSPDANGHSDCSNAFANGDVAGRGVTASAFSNSSEALEWVNALQQVQKQTAEAHMAFLRVAERSIEGLDSLLNGSGGLRGDASERVARVDIPSPAAASPSLSDAITQSLFTPPTPIANGAATAFEPSTSLVSESANVNEGNGAAVDLKDTLLKIVCEKTGYPLDMLNVDMDLESELGIDSIKRVEILSAFNDLAVDVPEVDPSELGSFRTLGEILHRFELDRPESPCEEAVPRSQPDTAPVEVSTAELSEILLEIVCDKTGYPRDLIGMDMDLESDLGIDSIKRVEILSAVIERSPELAELDPSVLSTHRTLGQIAELLHGESSPPSDVTTTAKHQTEATLTVAQGLQRRVFSLIERPRPGLTCTVLDKTSQIVITKDNRGIAEALSCEFSARGFQSRVATALDGSESVVICLDGLSSFHDDGEAVDVNRVVFRYLRTIAPHVAQHGGYLAVVQDTGGDYGLSGRPGARMWSGGLAALARCGACEWPKATVRSLDVQSEAVDVAYLASLIADEILLGADERDVAIDAKGIRKVPVDVAREVAPGEPVVTPQSVLLVTGGARGVTAACLQELARRCPGFKVAILGRTKLHDERPAWRAIDDDAALKSAIVEDARAQGHRPNPAEVGATAQAILAGREVRRTLAALDDAGVECLYVPCDVTDSLQVKNACTAIRDKFGPITGLVHAAGVLADKHISDKTDEQFENVFATKVESLRGLLDATQNDPIELLCLFSSIAARYGNVGQSDYAMANETLNRVAHAEAGKREGCVVRSINWGPWSGGMVSPELGRHFTRAGVELIEQSHGAAAFVDEIQSRSEQSREVLLGAALPVAAAREREFFVEINADSHGFLLGHAIAGVPVLPLVLVQEWFHRPFEKLGTLSNLEVVRGVQLDQLSSRSYNYRIRVTPNGADSGIVLEDEEGVVRYRARYEQSQTGHGIALDDRQIDPRRLQPCDLYGNMLFHQAPFDGIHEIQGLDDGGVVAELVGISHRSWPDDSWKTDPLLIDAGLQLVRVWAGEFLGKPTLPTSISRLIWRTQRLSDDRVTCRVETQRLGRLGVRARLLFVDKQGDILGEIDGLEQYVAEGSAVPVA